MGKNKKGNKANVFKVAGAKSLKKPKAKAVNLGLKNIKQKVQDIDAEFVEINKNPKPSPSVKKDAPKPASKLNKPSSKLNKPVPSKEDILKTTEAIVKMDL